MGLPHEGLIQRPIVPWVNALTTELHLTPTFLKSIPPYLLLKNTNHIPQHTILAYEVLHFEIGDFLKIILFLFLWTADYYF